MRDLDIFYPEGHEKHFQHGHPERPERVEAIKTELVKAGIWDDAQLIEPVSIPEQVFYSVHKPSHYENLRRSSQGHVPGDIETFLTEHSYQLALNSAGGAAGVAKHVWENNSKGFAFCRPPGHHATFDHSMGFCLINNIAVAAEYLVQEYGLSGVAVIDLDVHHGNGTQDIFYDRSDIFFFSIHQIPLYPMSGFINEKGQADGLGYTMNIPLPPFSGNDARLEALNTLILPKLSAYKPEIILISVGYDAHWQDPLSQQLASVDNYARMIKILSNWADDNCSGRIALFLEGGYDLKVCSSASLAICKALQGEEWDDPLGESDYQETGQWKPDLERIRREWKI